MCPYLVPGSCCWLECQWTWCLHEPWVLATYSSCCRLIFFYAKSQCLSSLNNRGVSLFRAVVWNTNERDVCRALSFGNLFFLFWMEIFCMPKLREKLDLQLRSVPVSCCWLECQWTICLHKPWVLATNSSSSEWIFFLTKLKEKLDLQSRCVPVSCCWSECQWTWCLHESWVLATYFSCSGWIFFSVKTQRKVRFTNRDVSLARMS